MKNKKSTKITMEIMKELDAVLQKHDIDDVYIFSIILKSDLSKTKGVEDKDRCRQVCTINNKGEQVCVLICN